MRMSKTVTVEDYRLESCFQTLRKELLSDKYVDRLDKPLAYWALPRDRGLPLALLGRSLKELLNTPFEELSATPGIGQKKIDSFVRLLSRATKEHPPAAPDETLIYVEDELPLTPPPSKNGKVPTFDPTVVSEALWSVWRATVRRNGLGGLTIGQILPSLQPVPTVIWETQLEDYVDLTLAEIRSRKTHGEKRVRLILEAFFHVHKIMGSAEPHPSIGIRLLPKRLDEVHTWIGRVVSSESLPSERDIKSGLIRPIVEQIRVDIGDTVAELCELRLGLSGRAVPVRSLAERLKVTRARVYQLFEDGERVLSVRWPSGRITLLMLHRELVARGASEKSLRILDEATEIFFPAVSVEAECVAVG
jgi:hypothetical protein